jgi:hypothetical protein
MVIQSKVFLEEFQNFFSYSSWIRIFSVFSTWEKTYQSFRFYLIHWNDKDLRSMEDDLSDFLWHWYGDRGRPIKIEPKSGDKPIKPDWARKK